MALIVGVDIMSFNAKVPDINANEAPIKPPIIKK